MSESCCTIEAFALVEGFLRLMSAWFESLKGNGFLFPVESCGEAFVATREAESFIIFYLVPKFDKTSFLVFTLNDKTACDCVSALMSAL